MAADHSEVTAATQELDAGLRAGGVGVEDQACLGGRAGRGQVGWMKIVREKPEGC